MGTVFGQVSEGDGIEEWMDGHGTWLEIEAGITRIGAKTMGRLDEISRQI